MAIIVGKRFLPLTSRWNDPSFPLLGIIFLPRETEVHKRRVGLPLVEEVRTYPSFDASDKLFQTFLASLGLNVIDTSTVRPSSTYLPRVECHLSEYF